MNKVGDLNMHVHDTIKGGGDYYYHEHAHCHKFIQTIVFYSTNV